MQGLHHHHLRSVQVGLSGGDFTCVLIAAVTLCCRQMKKRIAIVAKGEKQPELLVGVMSNL